MSKIATRKITSPSVQKGTAGRLFVLELSRGRISTMNTDGSDQKIVVADCHLPDGIVVDADCRPYLLDEYGL